MNKTGSHPNEITPLLYSFQDTARMLGCSTISIGRLVAKGKLRAIGNGRARRIVAESVRAYIDPSNQTDKVADH